MDRRKLNDYRVLLADPVRMSAYQEAIARTCAGKVVCEIGVGLGPLSLMALKAGALRVYGIDLDPECLELTRALVEHNGIDPRRFIALPGLSHQVDLPEKVDVILSETLDNIGPGENTTFYMDDARARFIKPGGIFVPGAIRCYVALARPRAFEAEADFWKKELGTRYGLDYAPIAATSADNKQTVALLPDELYSSWRVWYEVDFSERQAPTTVKGRALLELDRPGTVTGFAMAFEAMLTPDIHLRTLPTDPTTHWQQGFVSLPQAPIAAVRGDAVYVELTLHHQAEPGTRIEVRAAHVPASLLLPGEPQSTSTLPSSAWRRAPSDTQLTEVGPRR